MIFLKLKLEQYSAYIFIWISRRNPIIIHPLNKFRAYPLFCIVPHVFLFLSIFYVYMFHMRHTFPLCVRVCVCVFNLKRVFVRTQVAHISDLTDTFFHRRFFLYSSYNTRSWVYIRQIHVPTEYTYRKKNTNIFLIVSCTITYHRRINK